ncbi:MAG: glycoside hydrolase family 16 protein, partial [Planctomycetota bacterium]
DGGALNTSLWFQPTGGGTFLGRTQMRPPPPQAPALEVSNGTLKLVLDTFNPTGVGTFWGSEIRTLEVYELEEGLIFETRSRLLPGTSGGILGSLFMYTTDQQVRDEIDFEILSNDIGFSPTSRVLTNVFVDDDFSQPGASSFRSVPNLDITQFNDYRIEWYPDRIDWYINDALVRRDTVNVPDGVVPGTVFDPTRIHLNTWAPDQFFSVAFNAALQPAASQGQNQRFTYEVDRVEIRRAIGPCNAADIIEPFGTLDALDLSGAVNAVNAGFPEADFDASGTIDIFDLFFYLDLFESGCP